MAIVSSKAQIDLSIDGRGLTRSARSRPHLSCLLPLHRHRGGVDLAGPLERVNTLRKGDIVAFVPSDGPVGVDLANARVMWTVPEDASAVALAYGPRGFDEDRVKASLRRTPKSLPSSPNTAKRPRRPNCSSPH